MVMDVETRIAKMTRRAEKLAAKELAAGHPSAAKVITRRAELEAENMRERDKTERAMMALAKRTAMAFKLETWGLEMES